MSVGFFGFKISVRVKVPHGPAVGLRPAPMGTVMDAVVATAARMSFGPPLAVQAY